MKAALGLCLIPAGIQGVVLLAITLGYWKAKDVFLTDMAISIFCAVFVLAGVICALRTSLPRGKKIAFLLMASACLAVVTWPIPLLLLLFAYLTGPINPG